MRIYFKQLVLFVSICLTTVGLLFLQTVYYFPQHAAKDSYDFKIKWEHHNGTGKRAKVNVDGKHKSTSSYNLKSTVKPLQKPQHTKPLSHEELRWPWTDDDDEKIVDDLSFNENDFNNYLSRRKLNNRKLINLNKLPLTIGQECRNWTVLGSFWKKRYKKSWSRSNSWDRFYYQIGPCDLYRENSKIVDDILRDISTMPIRNVTNLESGTQIKFIITFNNGKKALFKPMRFRRNYETHPDHFYFTDFERHNAEIAAYHLDKVLGFRRAIPTVGRVVNISRDLWAHADKALEKTFFYSPVKNLCFVGKCDYYCDTTHAICGNPDTVEGSFQVFLPDRKFVPRQAIKSPYKRTYSKKVQLAEWQTDSTYCDKVVKFSPQFSRGRRLLDLVDLYILDFLMANQDRHHFETISLFDDTIFLLHFDNGRAFGKTKVDDQDILAPLTQCCVIRPSTLRTLLNFYFGPVSLSEALNKSMSSDPLAPILPNKHFPAIERRLEFILKQVSKCIAKNGKGDFRNVVVTEYFNADAPTSDVTVEENEEEDDGVPITRKTQRITKKEIM